MRLTCDWWAAVNFHFRPDEEEGTNPEMGASSVRPAPISILHLREGNLLVCICISFTCTGLLVCISLLFRVVCNTQVRCTVHANAACGSILRNMALDVNCHVSTVPTVFASAVAVSAPAGLNSSL